MRILSLLLLLITGLAMALPGLYLAALGGSLYYAVAGGLILLSAWLVLRRRQFGVTLFWLVFLGTVIWSFWEVGTDSWALMPRLVYLAIVALWLLLFAEHPLPTRAKLAVLLLPILALAGVIGFWSLHRTASAASNPETAPAASAAGEWTHYGGGVHGTRHSELPQI